MGEEGEGQTGGIERGKEKRGKERGRERERGGGERQRHIETETEREREERQRKRDRQTDKGDGGEGGWDLAKVNARGLRNEGVREKREPLLKGSQQLKDCSNEEAVFKRFSQGAEIAQSVVCWARFSE